MQLINILTVAVLALGVSAAPSAEGASLENRNWNKCRQGEIYNAHWGTCACPPKQQYISSKCRYPPMPEPWCGKDQWGNDQHKYCSQSKDHWAFWHKDHKYCENNGQGVTFCCAHKYLHDRLKEKYPDNQPQCKDQQQYNCDKRSCECPWGMDWRQDEQRCRYPVCDKPQCEPNKGPWCGKSKKNFCKWDNKKDQCENDGSSWGFCSNDQDVWGVANSQFDS